MADPAIPFPVVNLPQGAQDTPEEDTHPLSDTGGPKSSSGQPERTHKPVSLSQTDTEPVLPASDTSASVAG